MAQSAQSTRIAGHDFHGPKQPSSTSPVTRLRGLASARQSAAYQCWPSVLVVEVMSFLGDRLSLAGSSCTETMCSSISRVCRFSNDGNPTSTQALQCLEEQLCWKGCLFVRMVIANLPLACPCRWLEEPQHPDKQRRGGGAHGGCM